MTEHTSYSLSYRHAIDCIRVLYQQSGFEKPPVALGEQVAKEFQFDITTSKMAPLYAFVDEQILLLRLISWFFIPLSQANKDEKVIFYRVAVRQLRTLAAIRLLCTCGLDTNARMQLRFLFENSILWSRLRIDRQIREEYARCMSPDENNAFWHRYLSKAKTETFLKREFAARGFIWLGAFGEAIDDLKTKVGLASHPSMIGAWSDAVLDWRNGHDRVVLTEPVDGSHFTLFNAILATAIPFSIKPEPLYGFPMEDLLTGQNSIKPVQHKTQSSEEYAQLLRDMVPKLFLVSIRFANELSRNASDDRSTAQSRKASAASSGVAPEGGQGPGVDGVL